VAARVASDAATENFMAMEGVRHKIDSVYEKENRKTNSLVGKQWPSSGRPLYTLIQGGGSAAHCKQNAPLPQPPAALRCSEEHRIPVEYRGLVEEKAVEGEPSRLQLLLEQGKLLTVPSSRIPGGAKIVRAAARLEKLFENAGGVEINILIQPHSNREFCD